MTDVAISAIPTVDLEGERARARVRARYRSEARFRAYGLCAIALTGIFIVAVLADIIYKGLPAFTQHQLLLPVKLEPADIDPTNTKNPGTIRQGDFLASVRTSLRAEFPEVTDRAGRRLLDGMLSSGAVDRLRETVVADPSLIGQTVKVPILLSERADLYYKNIGTAIGRRNGRGIASPSGTTGDITISSTTNDFSSDLLTIKIALSVQSRDLRLRADNLRREVRGMEVRRADLQRAMSLAPSPQTDMALKNVTAEIDSLSNNVAEMDAEAKGLDERFGAAGSDETLNDQLPSRLVAINGGLVKVTKLGNSNIAGTVLLPLQSTADAAPGSWQVVTFQTAEANRRVSDREAAWLERLREKGLVQSAFNWSFFTAGDSREPELAGIRGALVGSAITLFVMLIICLPLGVAAAIYLEEFAPKNRLTEIIEVNINNLAAVPSIVFGLLGLAVFLNFMGLPRSAPLVGGLVLALLVLPTIIIASRAALKAVPPSIKEAALGVGASQQQAIFHHVLPVAMPGIMTGTIIGMAHALGETAPLLLIGMVAFIVEVPSGITEAATVLPVQIYLWSDLPEISFQAKTAAAIMVLLLFLFVMNGAAIVLRRRFERRW
jgi:phosphate transport system permease protein